MPAEPTVAVAIPNLLLLYAATCGVSLMDIAQRFGLDPRTLGDIDGRVPLAIMPPLWAELRRVTGREDLGLELARFTILARAQRPFAALLVEGSATLGDGFRRAIRYERLLYTDPFCDLVVEGGEARVVVDRSVVVPPPDMVVESQFATIVLLSRETTCRHLVPLRVEFRHPPPADERPYTELFGVRPQWGASGDRLVFAADTLDWPQPNASKLLLHVTKQWADRALEALPPEDDVRRQVRAALRALLPEGRASLRTVARSMGTTPRTLQRRLSDSGTSLREEVDELRRHSAERWVREGRMPLADIAFALGFSDQSAFNRAFARWTGGAPGEMRRGARG